MPRPIGIDLFSGAGGLSLGFEQAGFDIVAAVEIDPIHCAVHEFNFPRCKVIAQSVADLTGDEIRRRAGIGRSRVDVVFGGPPCQGFSMIGRRAFDDPRNSLVKHFVRLVAELRASYFVFENVKGLTIGGHRKFLEELIEEFRSLRILHTDTMVCSRCRGLWGSPTSRTLNSAGDPKGWSVTGISRAFILARRFSA